MDPFESTIVNSVKNADQEKQELDMGLMGPKIEGSNLDLKDSGQVSKARSLAVLSRLSTVPG